MLNSTAFVHGILCGSSSYKHFDSLYCFALVISCFDLKPVRYGNAVVLN